MKFAYAVTGMIHPGQVHAKQGARPGDSLIFTKALGTGAISAAIKKREATPAWINAATASMTTRNKRAAEVVQNSGPRVHAMTDVTGFGLIGHAREMPLDSVAS